MFKVLKMQVDLPKTGVSHFDSVKSVNLITEGLSVLDRYDGVKYDLKDMQAFTRKIRGEASIYQFEIIIDNPHITPEEELDIMGNFITTLPSTHRLLETSDTIKEKPAAIITQEHLNDAAEMLKKVKEVESSISGHVDEKANIRGSYRGKYLFIYSFKDRQLVKNEGGELISHLFEKVAPLFPRKKTSEEALKLFEEIGHAAGVYVNIQRLHDKEEKVILNQAVVYSAFNGQIGSFDNKRNAELALQEIKKTGIEFRISSPVFNWAIGEYILVD